MKKNGATTKANVFTCSVKAVYFLPICVLDSFISICWLDRIANKIAFHSRSDHLQRRYTDVLLCCVARSNTITSLNHYIHNIVSLCTWLSDCSAPPSEGKGFCTRCWALACQCYLPSGALNDWSGRAVIAVAVMLSLKPGWQDDVSCCFAAAILALMWWLSYMKLPLSLIHIWRCRRRG